MKMLLEPFPIAKYDFSEKKNPRYARISQAPGTAFGSGVRAHTVPGQLSHPGYATGPWVEERYL